MSYIDSEREVFGPLVDIPEESLVLLASDICKRVFNAPGTNGKRVAQVFGSYNIVNIMQLDDFKLVIRIPANGWGSGKTEAAARALESQVATMHLIAQNTSIPVPQIYDFDTTDYNSIGAPYICMSFIPGTPASQVWFRDSDIMRREELRLNILRSLAGAMAQLSQFTFDKMGSISSVDLSSTSLSPCYAWYEGDDGTMQVVTSGPFDSTIAHLDANHDRNNEDNEYNEWDKAEKKIMDAIIPFSVINDKLCHFVLCHPDLDSQNVMVDDQGNVTGLIDWDMTTTMPQCLGYAAYPSWITRDWDPIVYGWPYEDAEDSPETLERYRSYYHDQIIRALGWKGDWKFTEYSHIARAVWIATLSKRNRLEICRKLVQVALDTGKDNALDILYDIGTDYYAEEDWDELKTKLRQVVSPRPN
ncbi:hypothetical protein Daesc_006229 [Daldinia eschscholtzii]|uniref:Aminoglycoside phosphotransferase domain-containing protein n=1 Tax=Daldinia eschscholtzii TaxID=292717 RepID=A0AAX6MGX9_9PEZI